MTTPHVDMQLLTDVQLLGRRLGLAVSVTCLLVGCTFPSCQAGEWHTDETLVCTDCHAIHFSIGALPPPGAQAGGPWQKLLLFETTNGICLSCHDGSDASAPDVMSPVSIYLSTGDEYSAAGFFSAPGIVNENGHDLNVASAEVPFSSMSELSMNCATCHDPHGNNNYRNLLTSPGIGSGRAIVLGTDVFEENHPASPPSAEATVTAYKRSNLGYKSGFSAWCTQCHDALEANTEGNPPSHFRRHPTDVSLGTTEYHVDLNNWLSGSGRGFGDASGDEIEGIPRLRFEQPTAVDFSTAAVVSSDNEVFCLSCHLAHGGDFKSSVLWPVGESQEVDFYSGCAQCHNK